MPFLPCPKANNFRQLIHITLTTD